MPLVSIDGPAEYYGAEVRFAMTAEGDDTHRRLMVTVTLGALDGLAPTATTPAEMTAWVEDHRGKLETIASRKFDAGQDLRVTTNDWIERFPSP